MKARMAVEKKISHASKIVWGRFGVAVSVCAVIFSVITIFCTPSSAWSSGLVLDPAYRSWVADTFIVGPNYSTNIFWLNDETVVFDGYLEQATSKNFRTLSRSLFIWKLGDAPQPHSTTGWAGYGYCASDGVIAYSLKPAEGTNSPTREMRGIPGHEVEVPILNLQYPPTAESAGDDICRRYVDSKMLGRSWAVDVSRNFYLDLGSSTLPHSANVVLQRRDGAERKELPISFTNFSFGCAQSHQFTPAFFVWDCITISQDALRVWRDANCWPVWKVALPGGEVEKTCIPFGAWAGASTEIIPTKAGIFFTSLQVNRETYLPGNAGLYSLDNGSAKRVLPGWIEHVKVSPSGCKVAFVYAPHFMATVFARPDWALLDRSKVAVVDLCSKP